MWWALIRNTTHRYGYCSTLDFFNFIVWMRPINSATNWLTCTKYLPHSTWHETWKHEIWKHETWKHEILKTCYYNRMYLPLPPFLSHFTWEIAWHWSWPHCPSNFNNLVHCNITGMFNYKQKMIIIIDSLFLLFLTFFLSLGGSFNALIIKAAALGTTSILACLFCTISLTVIRRPFHSPVALAMSSPIFFGD